MPDGKTCSKLHQYDKEQISPPNKTNNKPQILHLKSQSLIKDKRFPPLNQEQWKRAGRGLII